MKRQNLSQLKKGEIVIKIIDESSKEIAPIDLSDKFFSCTYSQVSISTLEKYAFTYLDSLLPEVRMNYLNDIALKNIFPTLTLAKMICHSSLSEKEFCKTHKISNNAYTKAKKYADSITIFNTIKRKGENFTEKSGIRVKRIGTAYSSYNGILI